MLMIFPLLGGVVSHHGYWARKTNREDNPVAPDFRSIPGGSHRLRQVPIPESYRKDNGQPPGSLVTCGPRMFTKYWVLGGVGYCYL